MVIHNIEPEFIDSEDIVAKLHFLEHIERRWPYNPAKGQSLSERIIRSLRQLPSELNSYALAVFANVVYLPDILLRESWSYLAESIAREQSVSVIDIIRQSHLIEVDPSGHISTFLHENSIHGRLDTDRFSRLNSVEELTKSLLLFSYSGTPDTNLANEIKLAFSKPYWLVLSDNVLSGTSTKSDLDRCTRLIDAYKALGKPTIIPIAQVITSAAEKVLNDDWRMKSALHFDDRFRVKPDNDNCALFNSDNTLEGVIKLSNWLVSQKWFSEDERLKSTIKLSGGDMSLGFKNGGWTIVTPNCPTNSLPILWYVKKGQYEGPFPRIMSRTTQVEGLGQNLTNQAIERSSEVLNNLEVIE